ncbi:MAG: hypothetical protein KY468_20030 [Armatimonadetes bacterium]|nr:hypothetical protein [Armatimonadota bacterium]
MNRIPYRSFLILILPLLLSLSGCGSDERYTSLQVDSNLSPGYSIALESQTAMQAFTEIARAPVDSAGDVLFTRLIPGEYRLHVYNNVTGVAEFATNPFGVSMNGTATYELVTTLPPIFP